MTDSPAGRCACGSPTPEHCGEASCLYQPAALGENPKDRLGVKKARLSLVPAAALIETARVFELGARKYGAYNWRGNAVRQTVYLEAAMRHILAALDGEATDPESGAAHEAHALACMAIILDARATGNLSDDLPPPGAAGRLIREQVQP